jgi:hypothetical protein
MELHGTVEELILSINEQADIYDRLFRDVAPPIRSSTEKRSDDSYEPSRPVDASTLTPGQLQDLVHCSAVLSKARMAASKIKRLTSSVSSSNPLEVEISALRSQLAEKKKSEQQYLKTIHTLQDYLVNELNRCEDLEIKLKKGENELVLMTAERNKFMKLAQQGGIAGNRGSAKALFTSVDAQSTAAAGASAVEGATVDLATDADSEPAVAVGPPNDVIDKYVRKKFGSNYFFGLIVGFEAPYYRVCMGVRLVPFLLLT